MATGTLFQLPRFSNKPTSTQKYLIPLQWIGACTEASSVVKHRQPVPQRIKLIEIREKPKVLLGISQLDTSILQKISTLYL